MFDDPTIDPISCWYHAGHGTETLVDGICNSCNPYMIWLGQKMGRHTGESIRSIGVRVSSLVPLGMSQCSLFEDAARGQRAQKLETAVDFLRCKYGGDIIDRGIKVMHKDLFQSAAENRRTHVENPFKGVAL